MGHAAAIYTVKVGVKRKREEYELLGAIGDEDAKLIYALQGYLDELRIVNDDGTKAVRCSTPEVDVDAGEICGRLTVGQKGQRTDYYEGDDRVFTQLPPHVAEVRAGYLFRLPPNSNIGFLALHVPDNRGSISLLRPELQKRFREDFPKHRLEILPATESTALKKAVEEDKIDKIQLVSRLKNSDEFAAGTEKWVRSGADAEIVLEIRSRQKVRLIPDLLRRYLEGETQVFNEIVEFEGLTFDTAKVQADVDGGKKTFNIERPEAGHTITVDIEPFGLGLDKDGWLTDSSLYKALRKAMPGKQ